MLNRVIVLCVAAVLLASIAQGGRFTAAPNASAPLTTDNDDSCDIGVTPAATLLLPYFEIDGERTTVFSVTNVSAMPQIARVTIWTDWSFPVLTFNLFLTGYDVEPINLSDVIMRGRIGSSTSNVSPDGVFNRTLGTRPLWNLSNPNFADTVAANCAEGRLPGVLPDGVADDVRAILTRGRSLGIASCKVDGVEQQVGGNHGPVAIGYVTIDVVNTCSYTNPTNLAYHTNELLYDNVLIGDYHEVNQNAAGGNALVHIRAIPEGGPAGSIPRGVTNLPYTFYDRYTKGNVFRNVDRRQPLPSAFAARWISGKTAVFDTQYKIWREGATDGEVSCNKYVQNANLAVSEVVRFDERENANLITWWGSYYGFTNIGLPAAARVPVTSGIFPSNLSTDVGGWMFMNLNNNDTSGAYSVSRAAGSWNVAAGAVRPSQNWVVVSMTARDQYAVEYDAAWLGNGCSPASPLSGSAVNSKSPANRIGPAGGVFGTNVNP